MSTYWLMIFVWFSPITGEQNYMEITNNADGVMYSSYEECITDGQAYVQEAVDIDPDSITSGDCYLVVDQAAE